RPRPHRRTPRTRSVNAPTTTPAGTPSIPAPHRVPTPVPRSSTRRSHILLNHAENPALPSLDGTAAAARSPAINRSDPTVPYTGRARRPGPGRADIAGRPAGTTGSGHAAPTVRRE